MMMSGALFHTSYNAFPVVSHRWAIPPVISLVYMYMGARLWNFKSVQSKIDS
jgi:hypothetical protein